MPAQVAKPLENLEYMNLDDIATGFEHGKSLTTRIFFLVLGASRGDHGFTREEYLGEIEDLEYGKSELKENLGLPSSKTTLDSIRDDLIDKKVIKEKEPAQRPRRYEITDKGKIVYLLYQNAFKLRSQLKTINVHIESLESKKRADILDKVFDMPHSVRDLEDSEKDEYYDIITSLEEKFSYDKTRDLVNKLRRSESLEILEKDNEVSELRIFKRSLESAWSQFVMGLSMTDILDSKEIIRDIMWISRSEDLEEENEIETEDTDPKDWREIYEN